MAEGYRIERSAAFIRWLDELPDGRVVTAIDGRLQRLSLGVWGDSRPVGDGVMELRIHLGSGWRVYVVERGGRMIVVLAGGTKRRQDADIAAARRLAKEVD